MERSWWANTQYWDSGKRRIKTWANQKEVSGVILIVRHQKEDTSQIATYWDERYEGEDLVPLQGKGSINYQWVKTTRWFFQKYSPPCKDLAEKTNDKILHFIELCIPERFLQWLLSTGI